MRRRGLRLAAAAVAVAATALALTALFRLVDTVHGIDLRVYFEAGRDVLAGRGLYGGPHGAARVPFTYPPFGALPGTVLALLAWRDAQWVWTVVSVCALAASIAIAYRGALGGRRGRLWWVLGLTAVWSAAGPVTDHLGFGQIGLPLMALCLADADPAVRLPRRLPRGVLTGCAAAVKLIPAAYLAAPLLRGRVRVVAAGTAAGLGCTLLALLALPGPTRRYVTDVLPGITGLVAVGDPSAHGNQSLRGAVLRTLPPGASDAAVAGVWLPACVAAAGLTVWCGLRASRGRGPVAALVVVALGVELVLPVAWTHHYVWLVPAVGLLLTPSAGAADAGAVTARRTRPPAVPLAAASVVVAAAFVRAAPLAASAGAAMPVLGWLGTESTWLAAVAAMIGLAASPMRADVRGSGATRAGCGVRGIFLDRAARARHPAVHPARRRVPAAVDDLRPRPAKDR